MLEAEGLMVAAVTSIVGQTRLDLKFTGHANHAGTTPMHLRHDALAAAAEWIAKRRGSRAQAPKALSPRSASLKRTRTPAM